MLELRLSAKADLVLQELVLGSEKLEFSAYLSRTQGDLCSIDILLAGFISQQQRKGGVNFCAKESNYRPNASHAVKVETDSAIQLLELGYQFFGNRFCDTIYGMGMWEDSCWSGQIPTGFLEISSQEH